MTSDLGDFLKKEPEEYERKPTRTSPITISLSNPLGPNIERDLLIWISSGLRTPIGSSKMMYGHARGNLTAVISQITPLG